ncbi:unnamed protein product, partial [Brugia timori]|uniref:Col_cuticle_N domain-containing protein n=1 Tax=Brugia timori TaxID=42155 RepID=A0A0R3R0D5_9BILA
MFGFDYSNLIWQLFLYIIHALVSCCSSEDSSGCSAFAITACLVVISSAYMIIKETGDEVLDEIQMFRA